MKSSARASRACRRSWCHSSASWTTQSSYQPGSRSTDSVSTAAALRSCSGVGVPGSRMRLASDRASSTSTPAAGLRRTSVAPMSRICRPTPSRRASADRRLAYARRSGRSGHSVPAIRVLGTAWPQRATNDRRRSDPPETVTCSPPASSRKPPRRSTRRTGRSPLSIVLLPPAWKASRLVSSPPVAVSSPAMYPVDGDMSRFIGSACSLPGRRSADLRHARVMLR